MRVTNKTLVNTFLSNLNRNLNNMSKYQDQLSSGKEIRRPSDDPYAVTRSMELHSAINRNDQYLRNIEDSIGWLDTTDTALGQITDSLQRIRELMISSTSGTKAQTDIDANRLEIEQRIQEIVQTGNTMFDGKYIFAGNKTTDAPFEFDTAAAPGKIDFASADTGQIVREISPNVVLDINITASRMMKDSATNLDLPETLYDIVENLKSGGDLSQVSGKLLGDITTHIDNLLSCRGEVGAKANRMESAKYKNEEETFNMTEIMSKIEDIDLAEKVMEYKVMESVYNASLMTNSKILQPSLVDFLR